MLARALAVVPVVAAIVGGGCTLVLDPDNLPPQTDARPIDAASIDADPALLALDSVEPATVAEGTGAGGGRPALFVLHGTSLVGDATVTAVLLGTPPLPIAADDVDYAAAVDGRQAAITVRIPVLEDLGPGGAPTRALRLTVTQGAISRSKDVSVIGLPELVLPDPDPILPLYSRITIGGAVHLGGDDPIVLTATGAITIDARVDGNAVGSTPGPHGCPGGATQAQGGCSPGGGKAGQNSGDLLVPGGGGGGGGFGALGTDGSGAGGMGGGVTGRDTLVTITTPAGVGGNRGNGGGGGGTSFAGGLGGAGGGGGGVIALIAGGDIVVHAGGALAANGGTGPAGPNNAAGGGGGGSGGAILVRAGGTITSSGAWLKAAGGAGATMGWGSGGGAGGIGRIRIDTTAANVATMAVMPPAFRGPAWDGAASPLVDTPRDATTLVLSGQPGQMFGLRLNDSALPMAATPGADGKARVSGLPLVRGRNQLCAVAEPGMLQPESLACLDLFYTGR